MALVKRSKLSGNAAAAARPPKAVEPPPAAAAAPRANGSKKPRAGTQSRVAERLAAATEELASGLTEASAAAEELRRAMEQIASGATEAAGASQEQLQAIKQITASRLQLGSFHFKLLGLPQEYSPVSRLRKARGYAPSHAGKFRRMAEGRPGSSILALQWRHRAGFSIRGRRFPRTMMR